MRISVTMVATGRAFATIGVAELARAVEERGLDGLWFPDHTHIPVSRETPYPMGGDLPERYLRLVDPLSAVAIAAAVTERIRVGTGILLAAQRDPIVTAKALASIDDQSAGRVVVGVGAGWNVDEMRDHGVDPATRFGRLREHMLAMRSLWEDDVASFDGQHVTIAPSWSWPKPVQRPLPVLIGGAAHPSTFRHVAEYGQGWIPVGAHGLADAVSQLRDQVAAAGRDPETLEIVPFLGGMPSPEKLDGLGRLGATEVAIDIPPADAATVLSALDQVADVASRSELMQHTR
jgi:probable F420-dependent oxidoreductase